ncbi:helix-turn-helix domain-containing protein [Pseudomonas sp. CT11-2]|uniref:helix-turn-helix domain-containing protein n=1 Tax=Pseudomonas sp. CT11-2 TaxID=3243023 RepID=UPI0039B041D8
MNRLSVADRARVKGRSGQLTPALRSWCERYEQIQTCAGTLGLHRNTRRFRMERISVITEMGLN